MTLDQSLANLQRQADRLAGIFAATSDAIEAGAAARTVAESFNHGTVAVDVYPVEHPLSGFATETPEVRQDTPAGVVATTDGSLLNFEGENYVPQTAVVHPEAVADDFAPEPVNPTTMPPEGQHFTGSNPFETAEAEQAREHAEKKKGGRRTNEELAADLGVNLDDVKRWLGEGKRVTKKAMEEFKAQNPAAATMNNQQLGITTPPDGSHLPETASDPFGNPGTLPPGPHTVANNTGEAIPLLTQAEAQEQWATGPDGQPVPVSQPAPQHMAAPVTPENPFGQVQENPWANDEAVSDWSPFQ